MCWARQIYEDRVNYKTDGKAVEKAICKIIEECLEVTPYPEQLMAARHLYHGKLCDMKTGEGKTIAIIIASLMFLRDQRKIFIVTSNSYLSNRDYIYGKELFHSLGFSCEKIIENGGENQEIYQKGDVIYATAQALIFDFLRCTFKTNFDVAILDEVDEVLVENATNQFSLTGEGGLVQMQKEMFQLMFSVINIFHVSCQDGTTKKEELYFDFEYESDVILNKWERKAIITERGFHLLESLFGTNIYGCVFLEVLYACLSAKYFFEEDVNYRVMDGELLVIHQNSGRVGIHCHHERVLQSALEVKAHLPLSTKGIAEVTCSYPIFFSMFKTLVGISGTVATVPYDFSQIFGKETVKIPMHGKNQRREIYEYLEDEQARDERIRSIISQEKGPFLVVGDSDKKSVQIYGKLSDLEGVQLLLLTNDTLKAEETYLMGLREEKTVLISNQIVGRGTNIVLPEHLEKGLTVILANRFFSRRAEQQFIGRTGRNGRTGTCYILTTKKDEIFSFRRKGEKITEGTLQNLQKSYEARQFEKRKYLYLKSKLFFDQEQALKEVIYGFSSYKELRQYFGNRKESAGQRICSIVDILIKNDWVMMASFNDIIFHEYKRLRPYYQEKFYKYLDGMSDSLFQNDTFNKLFPQFIEMSHQVIADTIYHGLCRIFFANDSIGLGEQKYDL